ncbi:nucleotidyltransferase domain-containing protein [Jeotgalibacillus proteolyticus]|uniref:nucleotidyltransferase domain-containing protein n=1 Tax=Jeotgalibacillus proteolyticus TaxID=2082395 RepID=UPI003CE78403
MKFAPCQRINAVMTHYQKPWFFAGGWAIDLYLGSETRDHEDIEIAIFRTDQRCLKNFLVDWEFKKAIRGKLEPWYGEFLSLPVHELHALNRTTGESIEVLLNESSENEWLFRRDRTITTPLTAAISQTHTGLPYLSPEIVLLFKAKHTRDKDHQDFILVKDNLDDEQKSWLCHSIQSQHPGHEWLSYLL